MKWARGITEQIDDEGIDVGDGAGFGIENQNAVVGGLEESAVADLGNFEEVFGAAALADVVKDHDDAENVALFIADRGGAVVDRPFGAVAREQDRVVGKTDDGSLANGLGYGAFDQRSGLFVDDIEDLYEGASLGLGGMPRGERLGHGVHEGDAGLGVGGDHGVADAGEGHAEPLLLSCEGRFQLQAFAGILHCEEDEYPLVCPSPRRRRALSSKERVPTCGNSALSA